MRQPPFAALDFVGVRSLVKPALATLLEFEVLYGIGNEDIIAGNAGRREGFIEDASSRPDEGFASDIFLVSRLFTDQNQLGTPASFAGDDLGREFVKRASCAFGFGGGQSRKASDRTIQRVVGHHRYNAQPALRSRDHLYKFVLHSKSS